MTGAYQTSRVRRVVIVAELVGGDAIIVDSSARPALSPTLSIEALPNDDVVYDDLLIRALPPHLRFVVDGVDDYVWVPDIAAWWARHDAAHQVDQTALPPARSGTLGGGPSG